MKLILAILALLLPACLAAQTTVSGGRIGKGVMDNSGATHTLPLVVAATAGALPAGCTTGELGFVSGATAGQQIYECTAGAWTQQLNTGSGGGGACTPRVVAGATDTLLAGDSGCTVFYTSATAVTVTANSAQWSATALYNVTLIQLGAGTVTPTGGAGVTVANRLLLTKTAGPGAPISLFNDVSTSNKFWFSGDAQ